MQPLRRRYDAIIAQLIADARNDPALEERNDVLALMLQARYEDGSPISDDHVADELLTLLAAGHETTATTLAWAVERLRRHPRLLTRLVDEVDVVDSDQSAELLPEGDGLEERLGGHALLHRRLAHVHEWFVVHASLELVLAPALWYEPARSKEHDQDDDRPVQTHLDLQIALRAAVVGTGAG